MKMKAQLFFLQRVLCISSLLIPMCHSLRPIFLFHGVASDYQDFDEVKSWIEEKYPERTAITIPLYNDIGSLVPCWEQTKGLAKWIDEETKKNETLYANGYDLMCHSQGALLCRAVIEYMDDHRVHTYFSLSGPHMGEYGALEILKYLLPGVVVPEIWLALESSELQFISVSNYWNDPAKVATEHFLKNNHFLPVINNIASSKTYNETQLRANFLKLKTAHFFGSHDDGIIIPWESAVFGYTIGSMAREDKCIIPPVAAECLQSRESQEVYTSDTFGLKTLVDDGRAFFHTPNGVQHNEWLHNRTVFDTYVMPILG